MPESEKDYSGILRHQSNSIFIISVFAGFTMTMLVLFITRFSDPSPIIIQATLFLLYFLICLFTFLLVCIHVRGFHYVKDLPPLTRESRMIIFLEISGISLTGIAVNLIFVSFNLIGLALVSFATWAFFSILGYVFTKPAMEKRKKTL